MPQLMMSPPFLPGGDGVLLVTFDEGEPHQDNSCGTNPDPEDCGGHIWSVVIGPQVKSHYASNIHYMQGSQLRLICDLLGVAPCPGDGATSPVHGGFLQRAGSPMRAGELVGRHEAPSCALWLQFEQGITACSTVTLEYGDEPSSPANVCRTVNVCASDDAETIRASDTSIRNN